MSTSSTGDGRGGQPQDAMEPSVRMKQLVEMSHNIEVDRNIAISKYFHSGRELIKSAAALESKGEIEKAFVLYLRYMSLFLEKLIHHPEYSKADKDEKKLVKDECNNVFDLAEKLKKTILLKYEVEFENHKKSGSQLNDTIQKRSVGSQQAGAPQDCDIDEIDRKFDFSQKPADVTESAFDPFNIEELKRSFNNSSN